LIHDLSGQFGLVQSTDLHGSSFGSSHLGQHSKSTAVDTVPVPQVTHFIPSQTSRGTQTAQQSPSRITFFDLESQTGSTQSTKLQSTLGLQSLQQPSKKTTSVDLHGGIGQVDGQIGKHLGQQSPGGIFFTKFKGQVISGQTIALQSPVQVGQHLSKGIIGGEDTPVAGLIQSICGQAIPVHGGSGLH